MQARSSIARNSASAVNAQQVFKSTFDALINETYSITGVDTERYQGISVHALSKVEFSIGASIHILPGNSNLNMCRIKKKLDKQHRLENWFK